MTYATHLPAISIELIEMISESILAGSEAVIWRMIGTGVRREDSSPGHRLLVITTRRSYDKGRPILRTSPSIYYSACKDGDV